MAALTPGFDPLIAEAKVRMRRRRILMAVLVLLAGASVLFFLLRPSGPPATWLRSHGENGNDASLAHLKVPFDATEQKWRSGIQSAPWQCACGLTPKGRAQLRRKVVSAADKSGASVVRVKVWSTPGTVEVVLATQVDPAEYLRHRLRPLVTLLGGSYPYVRVVDASGSRVFEWYRIPHEGGVWYPYPLTLCGPITVSPTLGTPSCPVS
jgi:hypothetical protein